jgi:hypothetical protein
LERCAAIYHISPLALYRLVCAFGHHSLVTVLTRCGLPPPVYFLADETHSRGLTEQVYLPTIVSGRVLWHLGYTQEASAAALTQSYGEFQRAAVQDEASYRVRGVLTDGFDSTTKSMRPLFPGARLGICLRHALLKLPKKLVAIASPVRKTLRTQFHTLLYRARQRKSLRVFALGQRLHHFVDYVTTMAGAANGERVRRSFQHKKAGWYTVLADPQIPATSTRLDQAHNAIERKRHEGLPSSRGQPTGLSARVCPPVHPGAVSASGPARRPMWGGSGRRARPHTGLAPQPSNPHVRRLSMSAERLYHVIRWNVRIATTDWYATNPRPRSAVRHLLGPAAAGATGGHAVSIATHALATPRRRRLSTRHLPREPWAGL